jgi:hypothetical protein
MIGKVQQKYTNRFICCHRFTLPPYNIYHSLQGINDFQTGNQYHRLTQTFNILLKFFFT